MVIHSPGNGGIPALNEGLNRARTSLVMRLGAGQYNASWTHNHTSYVYGQ